MRPTQRLKVQADFHIVGDEIRVTKAFLLGMANLIETTIRSIEKKVIEQFYAAKPNMSLNTHAARGAARR